ncbi:helix-turn-helix domain-containing protein [Porifericola rhodea]|uniref:GlxA family transcriptional regulator n=1 Tax=Porifericola rhodea TaxID=930972 RepID=UPI002665A2B7|nr:helix-turn-helix domain-containing protein [Porifericola rhodea]WKN30118.1 helix-turn-helix domain-containing protein [Porifericola rhodea]
MKHVSILIPEGRFSLVNIEGTHQILSWVNQYLLGQGKLPLFDLHLVGLNLLTTQSSGLFMIRPDRLVKDVEQTDLIIIPAIHGELKEVMQHNAELIPWILKQYRKGAEVVSLCIGSFLLAATGLLDGKPCATHWEFAGSFSKHFPDALLMDDKIMTEADGVYTSGGAYSFTNLLVYLIEKYAGREVAIVAAKAFMIDIGQSSQSPFIMFSGQKAHEDETVLNAQEYIEQNFQDRLSIDLLCEKLNIGRRTFERRFKKATSNTVVEYMQRVKVEAAKKQMEKGRKTISEVMYEVGYTDTKAFREVFKKITGLTPLEYRNKYNKSWAVA